MAQLRGCSRTEAEQYIEGGWVHVDGVLIEEPQHRVSNETIEINPDANLMEIRPVTLLFYKSAGHDAADALALNAANHWPADKKNNPRVLKRHFAKLTSAVPLEKGASGLVVFTQDWRIARRLSDDANFIEQELTVEVAGNVSPEQLRGLNYNVDNNGRALPPTKVSMSSSNPESCKLRFAIKGLHAGLAAYLCEREKLQIVGMKRLRIGRVQMGQLPAGEWRYLQAYERF